VNYFLVLVLDEWNICHFSFWRVKFLYFSFWRVNKKISRLYTRSFFKIPLSKREFKNISVNKTRNKIYFTRQKREFKNSSLVKTSIKKYLTYQNDKIKNISLVNTLQKTYILHIWFYVEYNSAEEYNLFSVKYNSGEVIFLLFFPIFHFL